MTFSYYCKSNFLEPLKLARHQLIYVSSTNWTHHQQSTKMYIKFLEILYNKSFEDSCNLHNLVKNPS